jgi:dTMP kinase
LEQRCAGAHRERIARIEISRGPQGAWHDHESKEDDRQQNDGRKQRGVRRHRMQQHERKQAERQAQGCELLPGPRWSAAIHAVGRASRSVCGNCTDSAPAMRNTLDREPSALYPARMPRGFFLTFEGLDGSGKSTQLRKLAKHLEAQGHAVTVTRQPGGTRIGDRIRALLLDSKTESLAPMTELGLMFSDRAQAIAEVIRPGLDAGRVVLCDRFTDSSEAYQGGGRQLGSDTILRMHQTMCGGLNPDLTILLLAGFDRSLHRARRRNDRSASRGKDEGRFESEDIAFHRRVYDKYREIAAREPERVVVIEGDRSIEEIHREIVRVADERLRAVAAAV